MASPVSGAVLPTFVFEHSSLVTQSAVSDFLFARSVPAACQPLTLHLRTVVHLDCDLKQHLAGACIDIQAR